MKNKEVEDRESVEKEDGQDIRVDDEWATEGLAAVNPYLWKNIPEGLVIGFQKVGKSSGGFSALRHVGGHMTEYKFGRSIKARGV